jgi:hypothetical protein
MSQNEVSKTEVFSQVRRNSAGSAFGAAELELAWKNRKPSNDINSTVNAVVEEAHAFRVKHPSAHAVMTVDQSSEYSAMIETEASRALSSEFDRSIASLEARRASLDKDIRSERSRAASLYAEFDAIPGKVQALRSDVNAYGNALAELDGLDAALAQVFEASVVKNNVDQNYLAQLAGAISTREIRRPILEKHRKLVADKIKKFESRNAELAKTLGIRAHNL